MTTTSRGTITVDPDLAAADGVSVEAMRRYYTTVWRLEIVEAKIGRTDAAKICPVCEDLKPLDHFRRYTFADGRQARFDSLCLTCRDTNPPKDRRDRRDRYKPKTPRPAGPEMTCETCGVTADRAEFIDARQELRRSCSDCRGECVNPPYGFKPCPECGERRRLDSYRKSHIDGSQCRPFRNCYDCRTALVKCADCRQDKPLAEFEFRNAKRKLTGSTSDRCAECRGRSPQAQGWINRRRREAEAAKNASPQG